MSFSKNELLQYQRQMILKGFGKEGQEKLKKSSVLCIGAGGLGAPVLMYLAAAGIGRIGIVDHDVVDQTNLHRQIIHSTSSIGKYKTESAKERLLEINPYIEIKEHVEEFTSVNALQIIKDYDLVVDGTDNFKTRYLVNDASVLSNKKVIFGSIHEFVGQVSVFGDKSGPCYRCIFPNPPDPNTVDSCSTIGVFGVLPGVIGSLQATEAIKELLDLGDTLIGKLLTYDALKMNFSEYKVKKSKSCPICSENRIINELIDYEEFCGTRPKVLQKKYELSINEIENQIKENNKIRIIDIRDDEVLDHSILDHSTRIAFHRLMKEGESLISKDYETVFICNSGKQSKKLVEHFLSLGFNVAHLKSGLEAFFKQQEV